MLQIRVRQSKLNGLSIRLLRRYKTYNASGKVVYQDKHLGNIFIEKEPIPDHILFELDTEEKLELKNWLSEKAFAEKFFNARVDDLVKQSFAMPVDFYESLKKIYVEAQRVGIDFSPSQIILESLLKKSWIVSQKIDRINGFKGDLLPIGDPEERENDRDSKILFKAMLEIPQPLYKTCEDFEEESKKIGKFQKLQSDQLQEWAEQVPPKPKNRIIKKWCFSVAIDVLVKHSIDPKTLIPLEKLTEYWAFTREPEYTLKEVKDQFIKQFGISKEEIPRVTHIITKMYQRF